MKLSIVIPVYNEASGIKTFNDTLVSQLHDLGVNYETIYCNDGSTDRSLEILQSIAKDNDHIKIISLSRNFGKEYALTAGLNHATGDAVVSIDADLQHPVELIPQMVSKWKEGAKVVVGVRKNAAGKGLNKKLTSSLYYSIFNKLSRQKLVPGSTDFRLIDKEVLDQFNKLTEQNRITRGLVDWLGFKREYIYFTAPSRATGEAGYSGSKLIKLALDSLISMTPLPLYLFGYLGVFITLISLLLGLSIIIEQVLLGDPLLWNFTGTAMLSIFTMFLVGIILMSQGILAMYISQIHQESKNRPLYVIDEANSTKD